MAKSVRTAAHRQAVHDRLHAIDPQTDRVAMHPGEHDAWEWARLAADGEVVPGRPRRLVRGEPSSCHQNVAALWKARPKTIRIMTGYALSDDHIWRCHSWAIDKYSGRLIETTVERDLYYGIRLSAKEAARFAEEALF